jgi:5'-3' exonuclease
MFKELLIDGDQIAHIMAYRAPIDIGRDIHYYIKNLKEETNCNKSKLFIQGPGNYRHELATLMPYKGNRKRDNKELVDEIRTLMVSEFNAISVKGVETDDALGLNQRDDTIICSSDKDLNMIPGWHFNISKGNIYKVNKEEGIKNFYLQLLTGDKVDNIPGLSEKAPLRGIGPKTAQKILNGKDNEKDMFNTIKELYKNKYGEVYSYEHWKSKERIECNYLTVLNENAQLLWIQQRYKEKWHTPL